MDITTITVSLTNVFEQENELERRLHTMPALMERLVDDTASAL